MCQFGMSLAGCGAVTISELRAMTDIGMNETMQIEIAPTVRDRLDILLPSLAAPSIMKRRRYPSTKGRASNRFRRNHPKLLGQGAISAKRLLKRTNKRSLRAVWPARAIWRCAGSIRRSIRQTIDLRGATVARWTTFARLTSDEDDGIAPRPVARPLRPSLCEAASSARPSGSAHSRLRPARHRPDRPGFNPNRRATEATGRRRRFRPTVRNGGR